MPYYHHFLQDIVDEKKREIESLYTDFGIEYFKSLSPSCDKRGFYDAITQPGLSLIAEAKKASPSKGIINPEFDVSHLSQVFETSGASCMSVLTEKKYFLGHPEYISKAKSASLLPILRKDFILDPIQIYESFSMGADAILLIVSLLTPEQCQSFLSLAHSLGLDVLVEVHTQEEMDAALALSGLLLLGINNRNLSTFDVDSTLASRLFEANRSKISAECCFVAESGYTSIEDLSALENQGVDAVLIGEGIITNSELLNAYKNMRNYS